MHKTIDDSPYDWRISAQPETPYRHPYHEALVDKIFLCTKPDPKEGTPVVVHFTFEQTLERIRVIDNLTRGMPKIFYVVGWQFDGHDSKYPSWAEMNTRLKRAADSTTEESFCWLAEQARQLHSTVSIHINMMDAYQNSPLWDTYESAGCIVGKGGEWGGEQAYLIDYVREWEAGLARKRIDGLVAKLPLQDAGTVHIDAFWATGDPKRSLPAMRRIVRYWRSLGIDVTTEGVLRKDPEAGLIGLCPMAWHINMPGWDWTDPLDDRDYLAIPAALLCGGVDYSKWMLAFGTSMDGEALTADGWWQEYLRRFCLKTLPWQYMNRYPRLGCDSDDTNVEVRYGDGVVCKADFTTAACRIEHGSFLVRDDDDVFVPCPWADGKEIMAFSKQGYRDRRWALPADWSDVPAAAVSRITPNGLDREERVAIHDGILQVSVPAGAAVSIRAAS